MPDSLPTPSDGTPAVENPSRLEWCNGCWAKQGDWCEYYQTKRCEVVDKFCWAVNKKADTKQNPLNRQEIDEIESLRDSFLEEMDDIDLSKPEELRRHYYLRGKVEALHDVVETYDGQRNTAAEMGQNIEKLANPPGEPRPPEKYFLRCADCLSISVVVAVREPAGHVCGACGGKVESLGAVRQEHLWHPEFRVPCDARCTTATGPNCNCMCKGENHGSNRIVEVQVDTGGVPKVTPKNIEQAKQWADEYRTAKGLAEAAIKTKYGPAMARKEAGEHIPDDEFYGIRWAYERFNKAKKLRSHRGRLKALADLAASMAKPETVENPPEPKFKVGDIVQFTTKSDLHGREVTVVGKVRRVIPPDAEHEHYRYNVSHGRSQIRIGEYNPTLTLVSRAEEAPKPTPRGPLGTCQVCFHKQRTADGGMVLHGYSRPGYGYIVGRCPGVRHSPFEVSCEETKKFLVGLQEFLERRKEHLRKLEADEYETLTYTPHSSPWGPKKPDVEVPRGADWQGLPHGMNSIPPYSILKDNFVHRVKSEIAALTDDIQTYQKAIAEWKPVPWPPAENPPEFSGPTNNEVYIAEMIRKAVVERPSRKTHGNTATNAFWIFGDEIVPYNESTRVIGRKNAINVHSHSAENWWDEDPRDFQPLNGHDIHGFKWMLKHSVGMKMAIMSADGRFETLEIPHNTDPDKFLRFWKLRIGQMSKELDVLPEHHEKYSDLRTEEIRHVLLGEFAERYGMVYKQGLRWRSVGEAEVERSRERDAYAKKWGCEVENPPKLPAVLYHGTTMERLEKIRAEGLKVSRPELMGKYTSEAGFGDDIGNVSLAVKEKQAIMFAAMANDVYMVPGGLPAPQAIIRIDTSKLDASKITFSDLFGKRNQEVKYWGNIPPEAIADVKLRVFTWQGSGERRHFKIIYVIQDRHGEQIGEAVAENPPEVENPQWISEKHGERTLAEMLADDTIPDTPSYLTMKEDYPYRNASTSYIGGYNLAVACIKQRPEYGQWYAMRKTEEMDFTKDPPVLTGRIIYSEPLRKPFSEGYDAYIRFGKYRKMKYGSYPDFKAGYEDAWDDHAEGKLVFKAQNPPQQTDIAFAEDFAQKVAAKGGKAYIIGGWVRDRLMAFESKDMDIEVFGLPQPELEALLSEYGEVNLVGKHFGVYKVGDIDIALPRKEIKTGTGHKGFEVSPDPNLSLDDAVLRRDLTINAIFYDPLLKTYVDPVGGKRDIETGVLRQVRSDTFVEDPLRVYRVMQFAARFGFAVEPELEKLCTEMVASGQLAELPQERVFEEFNKMLVKGSKPSLGLKFIWRIGATAKHFPELQALIGTPQQPDWHAEGDVWTHTLMVLDAGVTNRSTLDNPLAFMYGCLCHDMGKPAVTKLVDGKIKSHEHDTVGVDVARSFMERLTDNALLIEQALYLVRNHQLIGNWYVNKPVKKSTAVKLYKSLKAIGLTHEYISAITLADNFGRIVKETGTPIEENLEQVKWFNELMSGLTITPDAVKRLDPLVTGYDLIDMGLKPGPRFKELLDAAYTYQMDSETTDKATVMALVKGMVSQQNPPEAKNMTTEENPKTLHIDASTPGGGTRYEQWMGKHAPHAVTEKRKGLFYCAHCDEYLENVDAMVTVTDVVQSKPREDEAENPPTDNIPTKENSVSRHCRIYKATNGKWYLELADREYGEQREATTYGPFATGEAASVELETHHSNPGSLTYDEAGTEPVPTKSPNGRPVMPPHSGGRCFPNPPRQKYYALEEDGVFRVYATFKQSAAASAQSEAESWLDSSGSNLAREMGSVGEARASASGCYWDFKTAEQANEFGRQLNAKAPPCVVVMRGFKENPPEPKKMIAFGYVPPTLPPADENTVFIASDGSRCNQSVLHIKGKLAPKSGQWGTWHLTLVEEVSMTKSGNLLIKWKGRDTPQAMKYWTYLYLDKFRDIHELARFAGDRLRHNIFYNIETREYNYLGWDIAKSRPVSAENPRRGEGKVMGQCPRCGEELQWRTFYMPATRDEPADADVELVKQACKCVLTEDEELGAFDKAREAAERADDEFNRIEAAMEPPSDAEVQDYENQLADLERLEMEAEISRRKGKQNPPPVCKLSPNPGLEVRKTGRYIRERQKDPKLFDKDTLRTKAGPRGHKFIVGKLKGKDTTEIQSILHPLSEEKKLEARKGEEVVHKE